MFKLLIQICTTPVPQREETFIFVHTNYISCSKIIYLCILCSYTTVLPLIDALQDVRPWEMTTLEHNV